MTADYTTHPEYLGLLESVLTRPEDDAPRLILADWIEEHGDDQERAHTIRRSVESRLPGYAEEIGESPPFYPKFPPQVGWVFRRGFVSEIHLTCAAFMGGNCDRCEGRGYLYGDGTTRPACETCGGQNVRMDGEQRLLPHKNGTGRIPGLAERLFRSHPITRVALTDKRPDPPQMKVGWRDYGNDQDTIPYEIYTYIKGKPESSWISFRTVEEANNALSLAAVAHGRQLAGLPPL